MSSRALLAFVLVLLGSTCAPAQTRPPNVVLFVADDLGWADLGCYGNRFNESPNIDKLAAQGVRFTQFYAAGAVCSPTRASLQTGLYPARLGLTAHIPGHWKPFEKLVEPPNAMALPAESATVARVLKSAGYATGYFGKWHLGGKGSGPKDFGHDDVFEFTGQTVPAKRLVPPADAPRRSAEYFADRAIAFVNANKDKPFFVQVSYSAVHIPLDTTPELKAKYEAKPKVAGYLSHPLYAGLLEEMDTSVGRVTAELAKLNLDENTLVIFTSDNGGLEKEIGGWPGTTNRPLRDEKGSLYEGGIRIPMIVRWPGVAKAGAACDSIGITNDLMSTFVAAVGVKADRHQPTDGVNLMPVLRDPSKPSDRGPLFWHYPHYHHSRPAGAIREGRYKAIEFFDTGAVELYDLQADLSETKDLAAERPDLAAQLRAKLATWRRDVDAQMPQRNPAHDPKRVDEWWSRAKIAPTEPPGAYKP